MYGCAAAAESDRLKERVFPLYSSGFYSTNRILSKKDQAFSYPSCSFEVQKPRETTARVVVCKEYSILHSYTCESSFAGGAISNLHFTPNAYFVWMAR